MRKLKNELANLRKPLMTSSWRLKNLGVATKEEEERAEKQRKKKFDDEMKLEKAKLEQKLKYETRKKIKTPGCQNWLLQSSKAPHRMAAVTAEIDLADVAQVTKFS